MRISKEEKQVAGVGAGLVAGGGLVVYCGEIPYEKRLARVRQEAAAFFENNQCDEFKSLKSRFAAVQRPGDILKSFRNGVDPWGRRLHSSFTHFPSPLDEQFELMYRHNSLTQELNILNSKLKNGEVILKDIIPIRDAHIAQQDELWDQCAEIFNNALRAYKNHHLYKYRDLCKFNTADKFIESFKSRELMDRSDSLSRIFGGFLMVIGVTILITVALGMFKPELSIFGRKNDVDYDAQSPSRG